MSVSKTPPTLPCPLFPYRGSRLLREVFSDGLLVAFGRFLMNCSLGPNPFALNVETMNWKSSSVDMRWSSTATISEPSRASSYPLACESSRTRAQMI